MCAVDACEVRTEVKKSGLVREDGEVRPADFAGDLMAEAIDGAVEFIVSLMEDRKLRRMKTDPDRIAEVAGAVDDRLCDVDRRLSLAAAQPSAGDEEGLVDRLRQRREVLVGLRNKVEALRPQDRLRGLS